MARVHRTEPATWIADQAVIYLYPSGERSHGRIAVGQPCEIDRVEASCLVWFDGHDPHAIAIHGASTLQALLLAVCYLGKRLHDFVSRGGRVLYPDEESDVALDALFGPMFCPAVPRFAAQPKPAESSSTTGDGGEQPLDSPPDDEEDDGAPDLRPADAALAHVAALAAAELDTIDQALLAAATRRFRKVAFVVATVIRQLAGQLPPLPDVFYAQRVIRLVKLGQLEAQGDLQRMRYGEVRRPDDNV